MSWPISTRVSLAGSVGPSMKAMSSYFRHVVRRRQGSEPPEVLLGLQDRFDTHFLDSPAWQRARWVSSGDDPGGGGGRRGVRGERGRGRGQLAPDDLAGGSWVGYQSQRVLRAATRSTPSLMPPNTK